MNRRRITMKKRFCLIVLLLLTLVLFPASSDAVDPFTVRVIYFQPADVDNPDMPTTIRNQMERVHQFYATEMDRHGFGQKTFRVEVDDNNRILVHTIKGKHNSEFYADAEKTHIAMQPELPDEFLNHKNANIFFIGGIQHFNNGIDATARGVYIWGAGNNGGYALIPTKNMAFDVVVHEVGHVFGLLHNEHRHNPDYVMGDNAGLDGFAHHEARWLDKSSYFNPNPQPINVLPRLTKLHQATREHDKITVNMDMFSLKGVHQVEIARVSDFAVIAWDYMNGQAQVTASLEFHVAALQGERRIWYRVIDTSGAIEMDVKEIVIPFRPRNKTPEVVKETEPEPEVIIPDTPEIPEPRFVPTRIHLTTSWASMKRRK